MKKIIITLLLLLCTNTAFASSQIGVVLIGSSDYKDAHFISKLTETFQNDPESKFIIHTGNEEQSRYQDYWFMKGFLEEPTPTPQNLMEYVNYSGYDKILFLIVKDPVVDTHKIGLLGLREEKRVSVEIKGFLIGKDTLLGSFSSTNEDDSKRSELRARQGAFKKCIRDIYNGLLDKF